MKIFNGIFILLGLVMIVWFAIPFFLYRILNIGNVTGIAAGIVFALLGIFFERFMLKVQMLWRGFPGKVLLILCLAVVLGVAGTAVFETARIIQAAARKPAEDAVLVVLGCRVYGERPSLSLRERLDAAAEYLKKKEDAICIVSGGKGEGESISEAECMYRYLVKKGISEERIIREEESTSTRENLLFSKRILEERGLGTDIAIATSEYHEYRAGLIAESLGLSFGAVPGKTAWWLFPTFFVRELYGILYQSI